MAVGLVTRTSPERKTPRGPGPDARRPSGNAAGRGPAARRRGTRAPNHLISSPRPHPRGCPQGGRGGGERGFDGPPLLHGQDTKPQEQCGTTVGGWRRLAAVGGWRRRLADGGGWQRLAVGGWRLAAVGSGWRLAVSRPWGLSLMGPLNQKKNWRLLRTALPQPPHPYPPLPMPHTPAGRPPPHAPGTAHLNGLLLFDLRHRRLEALLQRPLFDAHAHEVVFEGVLGGPELRKSGGSVQGRGLKRGGGALFTL